MEQYIKLFTNHTAYEAAKNNINKPNVAMCQQENEVHFNPVTKHNGYEYVDLGLPSGTLWATMNVGASNVTDYGNYYSYGGGTNTSTGDGSMYQGTENPLSLEYDTAHQVMGGNWHIPTESLFQELIGFTDLAWVTEDGVSGLLCIANNGNFLFFPAAGNYYDGSLYHLNTECRYWTSTPGTNYDARALYVEHSDYVNGISETRSDGISVRGVIGTDPIITFTIDNVLKLANWLANWSQWVNTDNRFIVESLNGRSCVQDTQTGYWVSTTSDSSGVVSSTDLISDGRQYYTVEVLVK